MVQVPLRLYGEVGIERLDPCDVVSSNVGMGGLPSVGLIRFHQGTASQQGIVTVSRLFHVRNCRAVARRHAIIL